TPLYATRLAGVVRGRFASDAQTMQADIADRGIRLAFDAARRGDALTVKEFRAQAGGGVMKGKGEMNLAEPRRYSAVATLERVNPAAFGDYPPASVNGRLNASGVLASPWRANV